MTEKERMVYIKFFTLEGKKHSCFIFTIFVCGYLFATMIVFLADFLTVSFERRQLLSQNTLC